MKSNLISIGQQFLIAALGLSLSPADAQAKLTDGNLYIKKEITGAGGIVNLIDSSTIEKIGTSTFQAKRLPSGTKMAITRIRLGLAVVDAANADPAAAQLYVNKFSGTEAKFRAANFIINRNGKQIFKGAVSQFLTLENVEGMVGEHDCYDLDSFRFLQGDEELDIQLEFPDNVQWTAGKKIFASVELFGPRAQY